MFFKTIVFTLSILTLLSASNLKEEYYILGNDINISSIVPSVSHDKNLFVITPDRYTKKIKSKEILNLLKQNGYSGYTADSNYIQFTKTSPIDTSKIKLWIQKLYEGKYSNIQIQGLQVYPRGYIDTLPKNYTIHIQSKNHLKNSSIVFIKSDENKQIYFDYIIDAQVEIYEAKQDIKIGTELSNINCIKKSIILDNFMDMPVQSIPQRALQSKSNIQKGEIITQRDVVGLELIKRGSSVNVTLKNSGINISFSAIADKSARFGESIFVTNQNGKKIKVTVTGRNTAEGK